MDTHNHNGNSPYKLLNELENTIQSNYSISISHMSKALMVEINKEITPLKQNEIL